MNEPCDRCGPGVEAIYRVYRDRELFLCEGCMDRLWESLCGDGWVIWPIGKHELRPQIGATADAQSAAPRNTRQAAPSRGKRPHLMQDLGLGAGH
jgi:hypothetical protein